MVTILMMSVKMVTLGLLGNRVLLLGNEGNSVFGVSDKFSKHDISLTPGKSFGYPKQMHATYSITKDYNYGVNQTSRKTLLHCSDSASRENSVQVLATTTNSGSERKQILIKPK